MEGTVTLTKFEKLETLRKAAWESLATRREFEWRVSLALWSLLAAFVYGVTKHKLGIVPWPEKITLGFVPILLGWAHILWLARLRRGDKLDKLEEGNFREEMRRDIPYAEPEKVTKNRGIILRSKETRHAWDHWNFWSQTMVTLALTTLAIISIRLN
jgi:hypothetical protein